MLNISVILATIDDCDAVNLFISHLTDKYTQSMVLFEQLQLIISDQWHENRGFLFTSDLISIKYLHNTKKGLSINRNNAIKYATGSWIMILDSDCILNDDYFHNFLCLQNEFPDSCAFLGKILSLSNNENLFKKWPTNSFHVSKFQKWFYSTSVNFVCKRNLLNSNFDENFGIGATYGSCEDVDYILNFKNKIIYSPTLVTLHPFQNLNTLSLDKIATYSYGFGALCRKHLFPFGGFFLVATLLYKLIAFFGYYYFDKFYAQILITQAFSRVKGFLNYKNNIYYSNTRAK